jgi:hypothetical protein
VSGTGVRGLLALVGLSTITLLAVACAERLVVVQASPTARPVASPQTANPSSSRPLRCTDIPAQLCQRAAKAALDATALTGPASILVYGAYMCPGGSCPVPVWPTGTRFVATVRLITSDPGWQQVDVLETKATGQLSTVVVPRIRPAMSS